MTAPEQPGAETAGARYARLTLTPEDAGHVDWSRFCVIPDHCTTPCRECGVEARRAREAST